MGIQQSPSIVTSGLVMYFDQNNTAKSYKGAPTTNLLDSPTINGLPTIGNGWGTYNVNQYGSGNYWSIGTIASVASNIVTMTAAHSLRSYDVMTPQSSGGGVNAGTHYLIKKLSSTTFSLHAYNGSQDGSQGYTNPDTNNHKVYDDFANDIRVSVNATSFPTMWWGYPHMPNSGLVKEVITNGFTFGGRQNDCLRLHFDRPDGVTDGLAYGPLGWVAVGVPHTVSFYTRSVTPGAVGMGISYSIYNYQGTAGADGYGLSFNLGPLGVWQKQTMTFTPTHTACISYWFSGGNCKWDIACIQFEAHAYASQFTTSSRSNTQSLLDLTNNNTITSTSLSYATDGSSYFNGTGDYLNCGNAPSLQLSTAVTISAWVKPYTITSYGNIVAKNGNLGYRCRINNDNSLWWYVSGNYCASSAGLVPNNTWSYITLTGDGTGLRGFVNGASVCSSANAYAPTAASSGDLYVGCVSIGAELFNGQIGDVKIYNRALSAAEVKQNFNALRGIYGV